MRSVFAVALLACGCAGLVGADEERQDVISLICVCDDVASDFGGAAACEAELVPYGRVATLGYCWGGSLSYVAAARTRVSAAVCYYGAQIIDFRFETPHCPVLMHFGEKDAHIPMSDVETIRKAQPDVQVFVYDADHGFNCNDRGSFEPTSAATARERTLAHFDKHLTSPDDFDKTVIMSQ